MKSKSDDDVFLALNELRLILLQEQEDGTFMQVGLDEKQFKAISDSATISRKEDASLRPGFHMATVRLNPDWHIDADNFMGLSSIYDFSDEED